MAFGTLDILRITEDPYMSLENAKENLKEFGKEAEFGACFR